MLFIMFEHTRWSKPDEKLWLFIMVCFPRSQAILSRPIITDEFIMAHFWFHNKITFRIVTVSKGSYKCFRRDFNVISFSIVWTLRAVSIVSEKWKNNQRLSIKWHQQFPILKKYTLLQLTHSKFFETVYKLPIQMHEGADKKLKGFKYRNFILDH